MKSFRIHIAEKSDDNKKFDDLIKKLKELNPDNKTAKEIIALIKKARSVKESFDDMIQREEISELLGLLGGKKDKGDIALTKKGASKSSIKKHRDNILSRYDISPNDIYIKDGVLYATDSAVEIIGSLGESIDDISEIKGIN